jgi:hypothetical protein
LKKLIAVALLGLHLFTMGGHFMLYQYFVYRSDRLFNDQISKNRYNVNDLVEIKIPAHTPAFRDWDSFEPISGQVQFKNACYNYVKLKITTDTIYLMCVPNYEKTRLFKQNIINVKEIADIPVNKKDHVPFGKTLNLDKYNNQVAVYNFLSPVTTLYVNNSRCSSYPVQHYLSIPGRPPQILS